MNSINRPRRGDIWLVDFDPVEGHEQAGTRPAIIVSSDSVDMVSVGMSMVVPGTKTPKYDPVTKELLPDVIKVEPSKENGLQVTTFFLCGQLRSVSINRFLNSKRIGRVTDRELFDIEEILILWLDLGPKE